MLPTGGSESRSIAQVKPIVPIVEVNMALRRIDVALRLIKVALTRIRCFASRFTIVSRLAEFCSNFLPSARIMRPGKRLLEKT
jgi:hypothetical protein